MKKLNIILVLALLFPVMLCAKARVYEAEKVVHHNFPASSQHTLTVDNKYGNINIEVWGKNEVDITVTIKGMSSRSQDVAETLVNRIKINAAASGNNISLRTEITSSNTGNSSGTHGNEISYQVKVPRNIAFNLTNMYGNIAIDECGNNATINVKYGNYLCTKMKGDKSTLTLGYGKATIQEVNSLTADIKYSSMTLNTANVLNLTTKYSNFKLDVIADLSVTSGYDDYKINEVNTAKIDTKYTPIKIDKVNENLSLVNKYGSVSIGEVGAKAKSLKFELGYTDLKLNISPKIAYELNASTRYGNISLPDGVSTDIKHREVEKNTTTIRGTIGSGTPSLKVTATNSYANIKLSAK